MNTLVYTNMTLSLTEFIMTTLNITQARNRLLSLARELNAGETEAVQVTHHGRAVLAILPFELYESLLETLEILSDEKETKILRQGLKEALAGQVIPWEKAKKRLGL